MSTSGYRKQDNTGRSTDRLKKHRKGQIEGQFIAFTKEQLASPAWGALTLVDRKVLDRLALEHMAHAGTENGNLVCTYSDFEAFGIWRKSVSESIARLETLGFIEITERGRKTRSEFRFPSRYRLTFVLGNLAATNEWAHIADSNEAMLLITTALEKLKRRRKQNSKNKKPGAETPSKPGAKTPLPDANTGGGNATPELGAETPLLSISRGDGATNSATATVGWR